MVIKKLSITWMKFNHNLVEFPPPRWMRPHSTSCCVNRLLTGDSALHGSPGSANAAPLPTGDNFTLFEDFLRAHPSSNRLAHSMRRRIRLHPRLTYPSLAGTVKLAGG